MHAVLTRSALPAIGILCLINLIIATAVSPAPAQCTDDIVILDDEFDSDSLADWQRHHAVDGWPDQAHTLDINETSPGHLYIEPEVSTWFQDYRGILVFKEVTGNFRVETRIEVTGLTGALPSSDFSLAGLMARAPRDVTPATWTPNQENWVFVATGRGTDPNNPQFETKRTYNSISQLILTPAQAGWVELRIDRIGDEFFLYRRFPGEDWFLSRTIDHDNMPETLQVGLHAYTDYPTISTFDEFTFNNQIVLSPPGNRDLIARYDYIHYTRPADGVPLAAADLNQSGSVDSGDVDHFIACATGPAIPVTDPCCQTADFDDDGDVDHTDFALLQRCMHPYGHSPDPGCLP